MSRTSSVSRVTRETDIRLNLDLDGTGECRADTGIGFFDHMLTALSRHALIDLSLTCKGDLHVDGHHTVEDCGIALGDALRQALGDKRGIRRFGYFTLPMDECLASCALDISGRPFLALNADLPRDTTGGFFIPLAGEFFRALSVGAGITLHLACSPGDGHHMAEALFKAFARALRSAAEPDPREPGVPSTKGVL